MEKRYGLSPTEYEIMELLWDSDEKLAFREILAYFNTVKNKNWKKQTLNTFLRILQDNGLVTADTNSTKFLYYPTRSKEEHIHIWTQKILENSFEKSLGKFLSAFTGGKKLNSKDAEELEQYLEQYKNNNK